MVGLMYAAGLKAGLDPPISAEEIKQVLVASADDIAINPDDNDPEKYKSGPGWDFHFGYGRNNARAAVDMIVGDRLPPEVDIIAPQFFEVVSPGRTPMVEITGRINARADGKPARFASVDWQIAYALGKAPNDGWVEIASGTTDANGINGRLALWDACHNRRAGSGQDAQGPPRETR